MGVVEDLRAEGHEVYSISRLNCINNCLYEAYKTYKLEEKGDENIYGVLGSCTHRVLEDIVNDKATEADLLPAMQEELNNLDLFGIEFPKDFKGENSVRDGWIADMTHFCNTYKSPKKKGLKTEEQVIYRTPKGYYLQGFIDLQWHHNGIVDIYDYKTSSLYKGAELKEKAMQLVLYALALQQAGYKVNSVNWIFLKYIEVIYQGYKTAKSKERTEIHKNIERRKISAEMSDIIMRDLLENGFDELDADFILEKFQESNSFDSLPEQIRGNYKMIPCVIEYELTDEAIQECIDYIETTIEKWESMSDEELQKSHREFTRTQKNGKVVQDTYYCGVLCPHRKNCYHFSDYLQQQQTEEESEDDLF